MRKIVIIQSVRGDAALSIQFIERCQVPEDCVSRYAGREAGSVLPDATPEEHEQVVSGQVLEFTKNYDFSPDASLATVKSALLAELARTQAEVTAEARSLQGLTFTNDEWQFGQ